MTADHVVLGAGAFETPRLLLRSGVGNPDLVGRYLMYHFQTFALGIFPFRLHGTAAASVTHLMDDPIVPDDARARRRARRAACPASGAASSSTAAAGHPVHGGDVLAVRRAPRADDARLADARPHGRVHDAGRGPPARPRTASTSTRT